MSNDTSRDSLEAMLARSVEAAGEAAYHWDIASDTLTWSANAAQVLEITEDKHLKSGKAFSALLDRENITSRYDTVMHSGKVDSGEGVPFSIEYVIHPWGTDKPKSAWLEDTGRWYADAEGRPREVFGIVRRIDERYENEKKLHYLGNFDPLTGLMNRASMGEALEQAIVSAEMNASSCAFLIVSVDNMSVIADAYGYDMVEEVIMKVGKRLKSVARSGDSVARYSESKFAIILNECTEEDVKVAAERFLAVANERVIETSSGPVWALTSLGAVVLPRHAHEHNAAIACAEEALAEAAGKPTSAAVVYEPAPNRISQRTLNARCAAEIVDSLKHNKFTLAFQPIVDATTGEPVMYESLLRMRDRDGDIIAAAHLIPLAEKLGLIRLIDRNVMELALATLRQHEQARLTMNLSGVTAADPSWFDRIIGLLEEEDNAAVTNRLVVEITETVVLNELAETSRFIARLRDLGCKVAIDDFGAGYTSFRNLKELDVDIVKLDGSFCDRLSENEDNQYFVRSLVDLAHNLDLEVIAEWVQREEDAQLLRQWGVHYFQGHLYGVARIDDPWPSPQLESSKTFDELGEMAEAAARAEETLQPSPGAMKRRSDKGDPLPEAAGNGGDERDGAGTTMAAPDVEAADVEVPDVEAADVEVLDVEAPKDGQRPRQHGETAAEDPTGGMPAGNKPAGEKAGEDAAGQMAAANALREDGKSDEPRRGASAGLAIMSELDKELEKLCSLLDEMRGKSAARQSREADDEVAQAAGNM